MKIKYFTDVGNLSASLKNPVNNTCNLLGLKQLKKVYLKSVFSFWKIISKTKKLVKFFNKQ